jgi:O-antigen/teichoic acid export membrane protein
MLSLALLLPTILSALGRVGQESVSITFAGLYKAQRPALLSQTVAVAGFSGALAVVCVIAFYALPVPKGSFGGLPDYAIYLGCLAAATAGLDLLLRSLLAGCGDVVGAALTSTVQAALMFLGALAMMVLGGALKSALLLYALAPLLVSVAVVSRLRTHIRPLAGHLDLHFLVKSIRFGAPICLASLAGLLVYRIDQGLLGYMVTDAEIGYYVVAVSMAEHVSAVPKSLSSAFGPSLYNSFNQRQGQVPAVFRFTAVISAICAVLALGAGPFAIRFIFGSLYSSSVVPFVLLIPGVAFLACSQVLASYLLARERAKYSLYVGYSTLVTNLVLNFLLIPQLGISGAALASTFSYGGGLLLWMAFYHRESRVTARSLIPTWRDTTYVVSQMLALPRQARAWLTHSRLESEGRRPLASVTLTGVPPKGEE